MTTLLSSAPAIDDPRSALAALTAGKPIVGVDDASGTGCELIARADTVDVATVATMVRLGSGLLFVTIDRPTGARLHLPPMTFDDVPSDGARMCVAVDATEGVTTGISARDRAHTVRTLCAPESTATSFTRPGHVIPVLIDRIHTATQPAIVLSRIPASNPDKYLHRSMVFCALTSARDEHRIAIDADDAATTGLPILRMSQVSTSFRAATTGPLTTFRSSQP